MRIALLIPTIDVIGGAERQVLLLAGEFAARGYTVTVVALSGTGGAAVPELHRMGVAFQSLEMRKAWIDPRGWWRYVKWLRENRPEVVHAHLPHATWFARWIRLLAPIRVLVDTVHTSRTGGFARRFGYRMSHWLTDHVTCVSSAVAEAVLAGRMAPRENMSVLPNGVPLPQWTDRARPASKGCGHFAWIAVGRLSPVKDYPTLLRAFATLERASTLTIAGSGAEEAGLRALVRQLGIEDRVQFAGFQPDVGPLLSTSEGFVLSSLWEGLPVGLLEAAAAGLPVVATDGPGTREAMLPGESGLVVPVGYAAALGEAMAAVMAMPCEVRRQMGARGRQFVEERFALPRIAERWIGRYESLLDAHPTPRRWRAQSRH